MNYTIVHGLRCLQYLITYIRNIWIIVVLLTLQNCKTDNKLEQNLTGISYLTAFFPVKKSERPMADRFAISQRCFALLNFQS
jgi:hypothetical protein